MVNLIPVLRNLKMAKITNFEEREMNGKFKHPIQIVPRINAPHGQIANICGNEFLLSL